MRIVWPITDSAAFTLYATAMSITPGPNNAMLAALGARYGFLRTVPVAAGVMAGLFSLLLVAGMGLGAAFIAAPPLKLAVTLAGCGYLAWLAIVLWRTDPLAHGKEARPIGFFGSAAIQVSNPKALLMALTATGTFLAPAAGFGGIVLLAACYVAIGTPCVLVWALAGDRLRHWLSSRSRALTFSRAMAVLVACTAVSVLAEATQEGDMARHVVIRKDSHVCLGTTGFWQNSRSAGRRALQFDLCSGDR